MAYTVIEEEDKADIYHGATIYSVISPARRKDETHDSSTGKKHFCGSITCARKPGAYFCEMLRALTPNAPAQKHY